MLHGIFHASLHFHPKILLLDCIPMELIIEFLIESFLLLHGKLESFVK